MTPQQTHAITHALGTPRDCGEYQIMKRWYGETFSTVFLTVQGDPEVNPPYWHCSTALSELVEGFRLPVKAWSKSQGKLARRLILETVKGVGDRRTDTWNDHGMFLSLSRHCTAEEIELVNQAREDA